MSRRSEFLDYLCELLAPLGRIRAKAMFGGHGIYCDERFFALIADDSLYLKADDVTRDAFIKAGQKPFTFVMKNAEATMSYYTVPAEALEDFAEMRPWAQLALAAAGRAATKKSASSHAVPRKRRRGGV